MPVLKRVLKPVLSRMLYIPLSTLTPEAERAIKAQLLVRDYDYKTGVEKTIRCYCTKVRGYLGVPRAFGKTIQDTTYSDSTSKPNPLEYEYVFSKIKDKIQPRDTQQQKFMSDLLHACQSADTVECLTNASTGAGKTVTALWLAAQLGVPTLITVPRERLKEQWLGSVKEKNGMRYFFGPDFVQKHVGIIQQNLCSYKGKAICIAMAPSLASREYPDDFYRYFGLVIHDEVHMLSAPNASEVFKQFAASKLVGLTATNKKGALAKICEVYLGQPKVISTQETLRPNVYRYDWRAHAPRPFYSDSAALRWLCHNTARNKFLANLIYAKGYKQGRNCVVFSDDVKQLQILHQMFLDVGVPAKDLGLYVGEKYKVGRNKFLNKKEKIPKHEYERIAAEAKIIFATYAIFGVGVDIKRLDTGFEASPRTDLVQPIGRITREMPGKPTPEWYTITDHVHVTTQGNMAPKLYTKWVRQAMARLDSYKKQKATVLNVRVKQ